MVSTSIIFCIAFLYCSAARSIAAAAFALSMIDSINVSLLELKIRSASAASVIETPRLAIASLFSRMYFFCASRLPPNCFQPSDSFSRVAITDPEVSLTFF